MDQGSNKNHSPAYNFAPTVTKFCVMWEGQALPHDTKFGNCRCKIVDSRAFPSWSLIHGLHWSGLIKAEPGMWLLIYPTWIQWWQHVRGIHRSPVNSAYKGPVTRKMSPFDDVIMRRTPFGVHRFLKTVSGLTRTCHRGWSVCKFDTLLQIGFSNHVYVVQNYCGLRTWNIPLSLHLGFPAGNIYAAKMEMITKIFRLQQKW